MAGINVDRSVMDIRVSEAVLALRSAYRMVENVSKFLANNPNDAGNDPLVTKFNYTPDEAYLIRFVFESFESSRIASDNNFDIARKLTGLE